MYALETWRPLLAQEELLVQEENLPPAQEEDLLLVQEEDLLLVEEEEEVLLLVQEEDLRNVFKKTFLRKNDFEKMTCFLICDF